MTIRQKVQSMIAAANTVTGESDATLTDAVQTLCDGYGGGGETYYLNPQGVWYPENIVYPATVTRPQSSMYRDSEHLASIEWQADLTSQIWSALTNLFMGCANLKSVRIPKPPKIVQSTTYVCGTGAAMEEVVLGSVGYPYIPGTYTLGERLFYNTLAYMTITIFVDAANLADIPAGITQNQPWGATHATVVYRNSATGGVIES